MYANGNVGLNGNQNHREGGKVSTRVLAPPGGASSFSLGGYSAPSYPPVKANYSSGGGNNKLYGGATYVGTVGTNRDDERYQAFKKQFKNDYNASTAMPRSPQRNSPRKIQPRRMRDSLDDQLDRDSGKQPRGFAYDDDSDAGGYPGQQQQLHKSTQQSGPMRTQDYADMLKQQIAEKKERERTGNDSYGKIGERERVREPSYETYSKPSYNVHQGSGSGRNSREGGNAPIVSGRRGAQPAGGRSSFSLGWD